MTAELPTGDDERGSRGGTAGAPSHRSAGRRRAAPRDRGSRPLEGRVVVVTRPRARAGSMVAALRGRGARVLLAPSVEIVPPERPEPFLRALAALDGFDWVVLTSAGAVEAVARAREEMPGLRRVRPRRLAVVGRSTAAAAETLGWTVDLVPGDFTAEALLGALDREVVALTGTRVLLPLAEGAGDVLPEGLRARGAQVTRVTAYRTVGVDPQVLDEVGAALEAGQVDLLTFTSPSTASRFLEAVGPEGLKVPAAVIGPVTAEAARELGFGIAGIAEEHTVAGLIATVERILHRA